MFVRSSIKRGADKGVFALPKGASGKVKLNKSAAGKEVPISSCSLEKKQHSCLTAAFRQNQPAKKPAAKKAPAAAAAAAASADKKPATKKAPAKKATATKTTAKVNPRALLNLSLN